MERRVTRHQVGIYPSIEPFGQKIRGALRRLGLRWRCLHTLTEAAENLSLLLINGAAFKSDENAVKQALSEKLRGPLRSVPTVLLDPPEVEVLSGWAEGYEARIDLALSSAEMAQIFQHVLSHLEPTGTRK